MTVVSMMDTKLPDLYDLSAQQIQQLVDDLRFVTTDKAKIFFAIDPHELNDFCFPIDPVNTTHEVNIKKIADDQAALFEIFYRQRPFLLKEYRSETEGKLTYYENTAEKLRDKSEMVDRLIAEGKLVWGDDIPDDETDSQAEFLRKNFSVILAIAMGIDSLGVTRLRDIYYRRLTNRNPLNAATPRETATVQRILTSYKRTPYRNLILKQLTRSRDNYDDDRDEVPSHSHEVDADAIDHLIYLNSAFEEAWLAEKLDGRYLFNYLSSAHRTRKVFTNDLTATFLPVVNGQPYNFWRTRRQIFAYVVHKNRESDHVESANNLERVRDVLEEVQAFEGLFSSEDCHDCVLQNGSTNGSGSARHAGSEQCHWRDFCEKVKGLDDEIQQARREVHNLGLINTLNDYEALRSAKPRGESQKQYMEFFRSTFDSPLTRNARRNMERLQQWILVKSEFTNSFTKALGVGKPEFDHSALRSPDDFVTGSGQYLPTKPKLWTKDYVEILSCILGFYRDPSKSDEVESAYKHYVQLDTETREINLEHELIRSLLYLALPRRRQATPETNSSTGDQKAYDHVEAIMAGETILDAIDWKEAPESVKQEFRYVQCWAARRSGRFKEAVELAQAGISQEPRDPRFFHGLCLSVYSWLSKSPAADTPPVEMAIESARSAIRLYQETGIGDENHDVIAANYNNLAYFLAWSVELNQRAAAADDALVASQSREAIAEGRIALDELKRITDPKTWERTKHPEFFHTEAYLEYHEFTIAIANGDSERARNKLVNAKRAIDMSIKLLEEGPVFDDYRKLRDQIERGLEFFG